jgi:uncharacterized phage protein gp47/JayE
LAGPDGNVLAGTVNQIETTLTDPTVTVNNTAEFAGGEDEEDDSEYRETIRNLIQSLQGATADAIRAKALTVPGVEQATCIETLMAVKEWDIGGGVTVGDYFKLPSAKLYIADANGVASPTLISDVQTEIDKVRAAGVRVQVISAVAVSINWTAAITLNPAGPNYSTLSSDTTMIVDEMTKYVQDLAIGSDFDRGLARLYIMAKYGPSGTNDLTDFNTSIPSGTISISENEKAIPGTIEVA